MLPVGSLDPLQLAWATGLFEGEGGVSSERRGARPMLHVTQAGNAVTPPDVLTRYLAAVGGIGVIYGPDIRPAHLPKWRYVASGIEVVEYIVGLMEPWLGDVKRRQAERVLTRAGQLREAHRRRPGNHFGRPLKDTCTRGHPYDDVYVDRNGVRHCRPCRREREHARRERRRTMHQRASTVTDVCAGLASDGVVER